jgi:uncharacterized protein
MKSQKINIKPLYLKMLFEIFENTPNLDQVVLFGSRARGDHKPKSDIDLAITTNNLKALKFIKSQVEESNILLKVDVIDINYVESPKLVENINSDGIILWKRI